MHQRRLHTGSMTNSSGPKTCLSANKQIFPMTRFNSSYGPSHNPLTSHLGARHADALAGPEVLVGRLPAPRATGSRNAGPAAHSQQALSAPSEVLHLFQSVGYADGPTLGEDSAYPGTRGPHRGETVGRGLAYPDGQQCILRLDVFSVTFRSYRRRTLSHKWFARIVGSHPSFDSGRAWARKPSERQVAHFVVSAAAEWRALHDSQNSYSESLLNPPVVLLSEGAQCYSIARALNKQRFCVADASDASFGDGSTTAASPAASRVGSARGGSNTPV